MEFKQAVITRQGRELMAKLMSGKQMSFTKVRVSSTIYPDGQLENLTALTNVKQETDVQAHSNNGSTVSVVAVVNNEGLAAGYDVNTVGLYAVDPDKGEILYSVSSAIVKGYMPADTGISKSGISFKIYVEVGNAAQVNLEVDPAAVATQSDLMQLKEELKLTEAWANSVDGLFDFTKKKWNENLLPDSASPHVVAYQGSIISYQENQVVSEWGASDAVKHIVTGGTNTVFGTLNTGSKFVELNTKYSHSIFIKNTGKTAVSVSNNMGKSTQVLPGKSLKLELTGTSVSSGLRPAMQFVFFSDISGGSFEFIIWHAKVELGGEVTPWISAGEDNDGKSFLKYYGLALTDSDNPADYVWMESPEYTRYKARVDNEDFQLAWNTGQQITKKHMIDFKNKVAGSAVANPNVMVSSNATKLVNPTTELYEQTQSGKMWYLDDDIYSSEWIGAGSMRQIIFKWNLVEQVNRDYPGLFVSVGADTLTKQVAFLKNNITRLRPSIWGCGSSPTGNKLNFKLWYNSTSWSTGKNNTTNAVTEMSFDLATSGEVNNYISNDGFVYALAHAEPSDGTTSSVVNVDYISLEYTLSFKKSDFDTVTKKEIGEIKEWIAAHS